MVFRILRISSFNWSSKKRSNSGISVAFESRRYQPRWGTVLEESGAVVDFMINKVTKIRSAVLDELNMIFSVTLERDDGAEVNLELPPNLLAEIVGLAGMASQIMLTNGGRAPLSDDIIRIVGVGASPTPGNSAIHLRFEDRDGFLHDFEVDDQRCSSLRFQLRRAAETLRKANADSAIKEGVNVKLAINNQEKKK